MKTAQDKKIIDRINKLYKKKKLGLMRFPAAALGQADKDTILALYEESARGSKKQ